MSVVRFNVNDRVRIRLTAVGRDIHRKDHEDFIASVPLRARSAYVPPEVDADGYTAWALWSVMQLFGPHIYLGCQVPFETDIEFEIK